MKFYEVRRQLQNKNRWVKDAFFQNREDAELYIQQKKRFFESKYPKNPYTMDVHINFDITEHNFHAPLALKKS